jgi:hypothetical protein
MSSTTKTPKGTELPLINLKGKPYLQVAHRLIWFREEEPQSGIETTPLVLEKDYAVFQAKITRDGKVVAMATKCEDRKGFPDFIEKAETGAIGRALALVGYGTQFTTQDLDEGDRLADSPVIPGKAKPAPAKAATTFTKPATPTPQPAQGKLADIVAAADAKTETKPVAEPARAKPAPFFNPKATKPANNGNASQFD